MSLYECIINVTVIFSKYYAKYCNEHACVCVCVYVCLSASFSHAPSLQRFLCMFTMTVTRSSSGRVTMPKGERAILGENVPDKHNTLSIANWTGPCSGVHTTGADA